MDFAKLISKDNVKVALIVLVVVLFLTESFYFGGGFFRAGEPSGPDGSNVSGTAEFNGTIRTYDPVLLVPSNTSQSVIEKLRLQDGVSTVRSDPDYPDFLIVDTQTRDDVYPIASWLHSMNASSLSIANVAVNRNIEVDTVSGRVNATLAGGVVRVLTEPLLDAESEVAVSMIAVLRGSQVIDYRSASLMLQTLELSLKADVESIESTTYSYSVPWGERNGIEGLDDYDYEYERRDSIVFLTPLDVGQILTKKQFSYITYIDSGSALVEQSFDNVTLLSENFKDTPYWLPNSTLTIKADEEPDIPLEPQVAYRYRLRLIDPGYGLDNETLVMESDREYDVGSTLDVNMTILALGQNLVSVKRVSLPS